MVVGLGPDATAATTTGSMGYSYGHLGADLEMFGASPLTSGRRPLRNILELF